MSHARESFPIVGETAPSTPALAHESPVMRRSTVTEAAAPVEAQFRFSRLGPVGKPQSLDLLRTIGRAMVTDSQAPDAQGVPAGYTYLGQFVDHDLTLDLTPNPLGEQVEVDKLVQGRSPTLDLDSVYGRGPRDRSDDRLYEDDGATLVVGLTSAIRGIPNISDAGTAVHRNGYDLPRVGHGASKPIRQKALIPDLRNDENLIVAQTHLAFMRFHNAIVAKLKPTTGKGALFDISRGTVVKHYQWMLRHDFLPRIVDPTILDDVFTNGRRFVEANRQDQLATMPVEFSVAAYRLGHSMIRGAYQWNRIFSSGGPGGIATLGLLFTFSGTSGTLNGGTDVNRPEDGLFERLPTNWAVDWRRLFDFTEAGRADLTAPDGVNSAKQIDTLLVNPLKDLPLGSFGGSRPGPTDPDELNLAFRNLRRATMVRLASGQQLAELMGVPVLSDEQIVRGSDTGSGVNLSGLSHEETAELTTNTPLWFYILREAELNGGRLTGVGGRVVAEVFHRAMQASQWSIVRDKRFRPSLGPDENTFRMVDLLQVAFGTRAEDLNPLTDQVVEQVAADLRATAAPVG